MVRCRQLVRWQSSQLGQVVRNATTEEFWEWHLLGLSASAIVAALGEVPSPLPDAVFRRIHAGEIDAAQCISLTAAALWVPEIARARSRLGLGSDDPVETFVVLEVPDCPSMRAWVRWYRAQPNLSGGVVVRISALALWMRGRTVNKLRLSMESLLTTGRPGLIWAVCHAHVSSMAPDGHGEGEQLMVRARLTPSAHEARRAMWWHYLAGHQQWMREISHLLCSTDRGGANERWRLLIELLKVGDVEELPGP